MSKIIGVTVGTPTSPKKIENEIKPVKTVNGKAPDQNGNVEVIGNNGKDGESITIHEIIESTESGGVNQVIFSDNKILYVQNGKDGTNGKDGANGKTAYQYAQEGGYAGAETKFSKKLATPFVTPQMYGAVGDGVNDDTEYFEHALAENDNVFVPTGKYLITRHLDLTYNKSLFSDDGQNPTIIFNGNESSSVVLIGRLAIFRNINIQIRTTPYKGIVFDTNNLDMESSTNGKHSRVEHVKVSFNAECQEASLIGITVDSGTDANNMPTCTGGCYQVYNDIVVDGGTYYGTGIKMTLIQGRAFTEATKLGFPWLTHISFNDIYLGCPYTAIKAGVENTSGSAYFERVKMEHILFNNVTTQSMGANNTRYFLDVNHIDAFLSKCKGWDYHNVVDESGNILKVNIIGEGTNLSFTDTDANFGNSLLQSCDFIAENESEFSVEDSSSYFMDKYFKGTFLRKGYDSVDVKIDAKMTDAHIADITDKKIKEILYSGYINLMENPLTQIKKDLRFSNSSQSWAPEAGYLTLVIPIGKGGNIIRWLSDICRLSGAYKSMFFFNDDELTKGTLIAEYSNGILVSNDTDTYLNVPNPSGYKYVSIPLWYDEDLSSENTIVTINQAITNNSNADSYTKYLQDTVISQAVSAEVARTAQPKGDYVTETELNDKGYLTQHQDISGKANKSDAETWTFTLADGTSVTKKVVLA